ncbi:MAG: hypothetical protein ACR2MX_10550 [Cyclobacteriaceae bacterium]
MVCFSSTYLISILFIFLIAFSCDTNEETPLPDPEYEFPEGKIFFDTSPVDLSGVTFFEPMGLMGVFPQDHGGFHHTEIALAEPLTPIYAMADGQIMALGKSGRDFWVDIKYSTTISTKLGHVGRFEHFILDKTGPLLEGQPQYPTIDITKGQVIAYVSSFSALDMGLHDQEIQSNFCYPEAFGFELRFAASIFDYFEDPVKSELLAKAIRQHEPRGGKVDYDVKGTLSGNWFIPGGVAISDFSHHFAIGYDHLFGRRVAIFDGYARFSQNEPNFFFWVKNNGPLPETVDPSHGLVKYEMIFGRSFNRIDDTTFELQSLEGVDDQATLGVFLFEMLGAESMRAEYFPAKLPEEVTGFTGSERTYVRNP